MLVSEHELNSQLKTIATFEIHKVVLEYSLLSLRTYNCTMECFLQP